jgi:hypothetical protein
MTPGSRSTTAARVSGTVSNHDRNLAISNSSSTSSTVDARRPNPVVNSRCRSSSGARVRTASATQPIASAGVSAALASTRSATWWRASTAGLIAST